MPLDIDRFPSAVDSPREIQDFYNRVGVHIGLKPPVPGLKIGQIINFEVVDDKSMDHVLSGGEIAFGVAKIIP